MRVDKVTKSLERRTVPPPEANGEEVDFIRGPLPQFGRPTHATFLFVALILTCNGSFMLVLQFLLPLLTNDERRQFSYSVFLLLTACGVLLWCQWRAVRPLKALPRRTPAEFSRLTCIGHPQRFAVFGPLEDVPFEPRVFHARLACRCRARILLWSALLAAGACIAVYAANQAGQFVEPWVMGVWMSLFIPSAAFCLSLLVVTYRFPTYIRLVPGRMDIVRLDAIRDRVLGVKTIDLRSARVIAVLRGIQRFVLVESGFRTEELNLLFMRDASRFVYYLFLAALSTHQPPPVADDELVR